MLPTVILQAPYQTVTPFIVTTKCPRIMRPQMAAQENKSGFFGRLKARINRGRSWVNNDLKDLLTGKVDEDVLEELETQLLLADVGVEATEAIMAG